MSILNLDTLPVEILYRIFDNLNVQTILSSIRHVCKHLHLTTNSYNRYKFDFESISKPYFNVICQLIPFENVVSLTLSNEDKTRGQIQLFLSLFHIEQFNRLKSLTLIGIDDIQLSLFLNYIIRSSLKSLSISIQTLHTAQHIPTALLSSAIAHHTLQNLHLNIGLSHWNDIQWPITHTLRSLQIVNAITLKYYCLILRNSPHLERLILKEITVDSNDKNFSTKSSFKQLKALTFEDGRIDLINLDQCLSLTPSLIYLKLIGNSALFNSSFDGYQWEKILRTKVNLLKRFDFYFCISTLSNYRSRNVENLIDSFRTSFWLNDLHCYIICDYISNRNKIMLYTLPICQTHFAYHMDYKKISLANFTRRNMDNDMDNVEELALNITKDINNESSNTILFRNVTCLTLVNDGEWPKNSLHFLSTILDLSRIVKLALSVNFTSEHMINTITNITSLFNQASNLRSLLLFDYWSPDNCMKRMKTICSLITPNIKHLQIRVKDLDDIKFILEQLEDLTSVTFEYAQILTINRQEFIQSLTYLNRYSSVWDSQAALHVWLGNKKQQSL